MRTLISPPRALLGAVAGGCTHALSFARRSSFIAVAVLSSLFLAITAVSLLPALVSNASTPPIVSLLRPRSGHLQPHPPLYPHQWPPPSLGLDRFHPTPPFGFCTLFPSVTSHPHLSLFPHPSFNSPSIFPHLIHLLMLPRFCDQHRGKNIFLLWFLWDMEKAAVLEFINKKYLLFSGGLTIFWDPGWLIDQVLRGFEVSFPLHMGEILEELTKGMPFFAVLTTPPGFENARSSQEIVLGKDQPSAGKTDKQQVGEEALLKE